MKGGRGERILIQVLVPPVLGSAMLGVVTVGVTGGWKEWPVLFVIVAVGSVLGMILSIPYAFVCDLAVAIGLRPESGKFVAASTFSGAVAGVVPALLLCQANRAAGIPWDAVGLLLVTGFVVGAVTGELIAWRAK